MPYEWLPPAPDGARRLHLWQHRSLSPQGFAATIAIAAALSAVPLLAALGTPVVWGVLPFLVVVIGGLWAGLRRSDRDAEVHEHLALSPGRVELTRTDPRRPPRRWEANPHWVRPVLHVTGGPVPHYLTLQGGPREVELGAFLSEDERIALRAELQAALASLR
jgi:uncharacterized membrane protein